MAAWYGLPARWAIAAVRTPGAGVGDTGGEHGWPMAAGLAVDAVIVTDDDSISGADVYPRADVRSWLFDRAEMASSVPAARQPARPKLSGRMRNVAEPMPAESAGCQSGNRVGHPAELADRRELAMLAHRPAEQLLRVGVDRV
jgi:hypothetical protein